MTQIVIKSLGTAAIYIAGGIPKNFINDSVVMSYIFGLNRENDCAVQLKTAVIHDGGLATRTNLPSATYVSTRLSGAKRGAPRGNPHVLRAVRPRRSRLSMKILRRRMYPGTTSIWRLQCRRRRLVSREPQPPKNHRHRSPKEGK
jgi:hypothetical protein